MKRKQAKSEEKIAVSNLSAISQMGTMYLRDWGAIKEEIVEQSSTQLNKTSRPICLQLKKPKNRSQIKVCPPKRERLVLKQKPGNEAVKNQSLRQRQEEASSPSQKIQQTVELATSDTRRSLQKLVNGTPVSLKEPEAGKSPMVEKLDKQYTYSYERLRKMSLPWLKCVPHASRSDKKEQALDQYRKINEACRRKARMSKVNHHVSNKYINPEVVGQTCRQKTDQPSDHQIQLLKSWIERNNSKRSRSITSLLREHFEHKYMEKKRQRERLTSMGMGSKCQNGKSAGGF